MDRTPQRTMKYALNESTKSGEILLSVSEEALIDNVTYEFDGTSFTAVARFKCDHYGECVVSKQMTARAKSISAADLKIMAQLANAELDKIVTTSSWVAVFNMTPENPVRIQENYKKPPEGFSVSFIPELQ